MIPLYQLFQGFAIENELFPSKKAVSFLLGKGTNKFSFFPFLSDNRMYISLDKAVALKYNETKV